MAYPRWLEAVRYYGKRQVWQEMHGRVLERADWQVETSQDDGSTHGSGGARSRKKANETDGARHAADRDHRTHCAEVRGQRRWMAQEEKGSEGVGMGSVHSLVRGRTWRSNEMKHREKCCHIRLRLSRHRQVPQRCVVASADNPRTCL